MHHIFSSSLLLAALAGYAHAQSTTGFELASVTPTPAGAAVPNASAVAAYLLPSETITSISPEQSSKFFADASSFVTAYTALHPLSALEFDIGADELFASTTPSAAQISQISGLLAEADQALAADPGAYVSSVNALISPFPFATDVATYEQGIVQGLQTIAANDFSAPLPSATAGSASGSGSGGSSSDGAPRPAAALGGSTVVSCAIALAVGVVCMGML